MKKRLALLFTLAISGSTMAEPTTKTVATELLDPQYPTMQQWGQAGVITDDITRDSPTEVWLKPGDDLAAAAAQENTTIHLAAGIYPLEETLTIASHVLIRGSGISRTRLVIMLRDHLADIPKEKASRAGILFASAEGSGLENLTVVMDESLIPPIDPSDGPYAYDNDPDGQDDLYITMVHFEQSKSSWLMDCELRNAGAHPVIIHQSQHITIERSDIIGSYNKSKGFGTITISDSEFCLLFDLRITDINHLVFRTGSRHNVIDQSRLIVDIRFLDESTDHNLVQNTSVTVPSWHHTPPITHVVSNNPGVSRNLVYFCTITRNFPTANRHFSVADDPNKVYALTKAITREATVEAIGPAPIRNTLWPVRFE